MSTHFYRPAEGHRLAHDPFNSIVAPRPIGWVGTVSPDGVRNLAPYSFFNAFYYSPPLVGFCSNGWKDSVANAEASGEFTWNLVTRDLLEAMNATSTQRSVDEWDEAAIESAASSEIAPPRVAATPVAFECRVTQTIRLLNRAGAELEGWLVMGEVVGVHIDEQYVVDGSYDTAAAQPVLRGGGPTAYFGLGERFDLRRPD